MGACLDLDQRGHVDPGQGIAMMPRDLDGQSAEAQPMTNQVDLALGVLGKSP
jgi:hypothetical protein